MSTANTHSNTLLLGKIHVGPTILGVDLR